MSTRTTPAPPAGPRHRPGLGRLGPLYRLGTAHPVVHHLLLAHFLLAGYLFAWSIAGSDPAPGRPPIRTRAAVLVLAAAAHAYLAKVLYAWAPALPPGGGQDIDALRQAAVWMYYGGDAAEILLAVLLFAGWYRLRRVPGTAPGRAGTCRATPGEPRGALPFDM